MIGLRAQAGLLFVEPDPRFTFSGGPKWIPYLVVFLMNPFNDLHHSAVFNCGAVSQGHMTPAAVTDLPGNAATSNSIRFIS